MLFPDHIPSVQLVTDIPKTVIRRATELQAGDTLRDGRTIDHVRIAHMLVRVFFTSGHRPATYVVYEDVHVLA